MRDKKGLHNNHVSGLTLLPLEIRGDHYGRVGFSTMLAELFNLLAGLWSVMNRASYVFRGRSHVIDLVQNLSLGLELLDQGLR